MHILYGIKRRYRSKPRLASRLRAVVLLLLQLLGGGVEREGETAASMPGLPEAVECVGVEDVGVVGLGGSA